MSLRTDVRRRVRRTRLAERVHGTFKKQQRTVDAYVVADNLVSVGGQLHTASVAGATGSVVRMVNVGRPGAALYKPEDVGGALAFSGVGGTGEGGGSGDTYYAGAGLQLASTTFSVDLHTYSGLSIDEFTNGLLLDSSVAGAGLSYINAVLAVATGPGLTIDNDVVKISLGSFSGLSTTSGLVVDPSIAGAGLTLTAGVLNIGEGDGIDIDSENIAVDVTEIIDTGHALYANNNNIRVNLGSGLIYGFGGAAEVNPGHGLEIVSNFVRVDENAAFTWTNTHQFNSDPQINSNLDFIGADRTVTASNALYLTAATTLGLGPAGNVIIPNAQNIQTVNFGDLPTGITGMRMWEHSTGLRALALNAAKFDELHARVFVADEVRIDRGEEFWSKSYGIVEEAFTVPNDEATVDVWFEESPGLATAKLFSVGDALLLRHIDWETGINIYYAWFEVVDAGADDYIQRADASGGRPDRQQWRLLLRVGGANFADSGATPSVVGNKINAGAVMVDAGKVGDGWIHMNALASATSTGPYLQMGRMSTGLTSSVVPTFSQRVRMGRLNGVAGISTDIYGFIAGKDITTAIGSGFEGIVIDDTNGVRLYNTKIDLYDGTTRVFYVDRTEGINLLADSSDYSNRERYITWYSNLTSFTNPLAYMGTFAVSGGNKTRIWASTPNASSSLILESSQGASISLSYNSVNILTGASGEIFVGGGPVKIGTSPYPLEIPVIVKTNTLWARTSGTSLELRNYSETNSFYFTDAGRVGVRTNSPATQLHVVSNDYAVAQLQSYSAFGSSLLLYETNGTANLRRTYLRHLSDGFEIGTSTDALAYNAYALRIESSSRLITAPVGFTSLNTAGDVVLSHATLRTVRTSSNTTGLILTGGISFTEGPYINLIAKDSGGSADGSIDYVATTESSALGYHRWHIYSGSAWYVLMQLSSAGDLGIGGAPVDGVRLLLEDTERPMLQLYRTGDSRRGRFAKSSSYSTYMSENIYYNGSAWYLDYTSNGGWLFQLNAQGTAGLYSFSAGSGSRTAVPVWTVDAPTDTPTMSIQRPVSFGGGFAGGWSSSGIVLGTGWDMPASPYNVQYRKVGDIVYLRGFATKNGNGTSSHSNILQLPVGYRCTQGISFQVPIGGNNDYSRFRLIVSETGWCSLNVMNSGDSWGTFVDNDWVVFDISFFTT